MEWKEFPANKPGNDAMCIVCNEKWAFFRYFVAIYHERDDVFIDATYQRHGECPMHITHYIEIPPISCRHENGSDMKENHVVGINDMIYRPPITTKGNIMDREIRKIKQTAKKEVKDLDKLEKTDKKRDKVVEIGKKAMKKGCK